jgi:6-phosphofructokinase 1
MNFLVKSLGACTIRSPLIDSFLSRESAFVSDGTRVLYRVVVDKNGSPPDLDESFELAGPREMIYFDPARVQSAIVTCGGLSPGLNDVIRAIVMESHYRYGAPPVLGIRYGYNGLNRERGYEPLELTPQVVLDIHQEGGTILGSSRGGTEDMEVLVDTLEQRGINILYTIGGDGTHRGAHRIANIALERKLNLSVVGVPKTIDNDMSYLQRTFGFETAFSKAVDAITAAHVEAEGAPNGIGLVKLMGRHSGFIAANATLAMNDVNFVLVPEVPFDLDGDNGFLRYLEKRLERRGHAVICVAEGAGQDLLMKDTSQQKCDASGNIVLEDIGVYLKMKISEYFKELNVPINLKYIDPSYMIRSAPANPNDSIFCTLLGQFAVHAAMMGRTDITIGQWNNVYTHVPIELVISKRNQIDPNSRFWYNVLEATGQPVSMVN